MDKADATRRSWSGRLLAAVRRAVGPDAASRPDPVAERLLTEMRDLIREQAAAIERQSDETLRLQRQMLETQQVIASAAADLRWKYTETIRDDTWRRTTVAADPLDLLGGPAQVYSQTAEDTMIAEIFRRIGERDRFFVEFGIEDGTENTTRWLLEQGWRGVWVEGSPASVERAQAIFAGPVGEGRLAVVHAMAAPEDADAILRRAGAPDRIDFLSVDIDHNTGHLWEALQIRARVCCIEYNAALPPSSDIVVAYEPGHGWDGTNWFGASLKALERIGRGKDMALVGCDFAGINAYFVDQDEAAGRFSEPFTAEAKHRPPRYHLVAKAGHPPSRGPRPWRRGEERA